ncbi:diadenosine tetraphosphatase [Raoultella planticola]|uniref:Diadenosine tetraphosphatase n=1 Tax=Raoultella planticola TaxID=575 RepID=A0A485ACK7_RAOPL|nr:diadenosine tetraphosphatase [Raoultella planticola]
MLHSGLPERHRIFIGDIHGQYHKLSALLDHLDALYQRDERLLIFVGDLIDNQPGAPIDHLAVLERVRAEVESRRAICLMGNHEFNAVGWSMRHPQSAQPCGRIHRIIDVSIRRFWPMLSKTLRGIISGSTGLKPCRCLLIMAIFGRYMPAGKMRQLPGYGRGWMNRID